MTDARLVPPPARPAKRRSWLSRIPAPFVRAVLKGHSSLGLAFAAAIYLVCLSGTLAVFAREFQRWENPHAPHVAVASADAIQAAMTGARARVGGTIEHAYIYPAMPDLPWLMVVTDTGDFSYRSWVADGSGRVTAEAPSPWSEFVSALHTKLHLPHSWGRFLVGLVGVALLSLLISGVLAHPRIFRDAFHLRLGGSRRLQEADLHNRLGVWAMPFHVIVAVTGAFLGLTTLIVGILGMALFQGDVGKVYGLFFAGEPKEDARPAPVLDLRPMLADVARRAPGGRVTFIGVEHPGERGAAASFNVETPRDRLNNGDAYTYDRSGLYHRAVADENNLGKDVIGAIGTLHFGWFGGIAVKIAYGLLGLAMTYLAAGGVLIWLARRRDKGDPAPAWERAWAACIWGQPLAIAAAAAAAMLLPALGERGLLILWGAIGLAALAAAAAGLGAAAIARIGRIGTAALMLVAALAHVVLRQGLGGDMAGAWIDAALVIGALLIVRPMRRRPA